MSARNFNIYETKKQGVIRVLDANGLKAVDYRGTKVVKELDAFTIELNSGGWKSPTTKRAINRYFQQRNVKATLFQKDFVWYVSYKGQTVNFYDGIKLGV